jgi:hypothetical protein
MSKSELEGEHFLVSTFQFLFTDTLLSWACFAVQLFHKSLEFMDLPLSNSLLELDDSLNYRNNLLNQPHGTIFLSSDHQKANNGADTSTDGCHHVRN